MLQAGKRACCLLRTISLRAMSTDPLQDSIASILENANRFHAEHGEKSEKSTGKIDSLSEEVLKHDDYFGVKEYFTLQDLFECKLHQGHHEGMWHPSNAKYLLGARNDMHIINLASTRQHFWKALNVASHIAFRGGIILFVNQSARFDFITQHAARQCGEFFMTDDDWKHGKFEELNKKPDLVICTSVSKSSVLVRNCHMSNIPTIGLVDTDVDPVYLTYSIPGNDDGSESIVFTQGLFSMAISRAKYLRTLAMKDNNDLKKVLTEEVTEEISSGTTIAEGVVSKEPVIEEPIVPLEPLPLEPPTGTVFDWRCKSCTEMNAKQNIQCINCSTAKYQSVQVLKTKPGKVRHWQCQACKGTNIAKYKVCAKCKVGTKADGIKANWECKKCNGWNFKSLGRCITCETPKGQ